MINSGIPPLLDDMAHRLHVHYGVPPSTLEQQVKVIGRDMPAGMYRRIVVLVRAEQKMRNPKQSRKVSLEKVQIAHAKVLPYLKAAPGNARLYGHGGRLMGRVVFNLILFATVLWLFVWWRGVA